MSDPYPPFTDNSDEAGPSRSQNHYQHAWYDTFSQEDKQIYDGYHPDAHDQPPVHEGFIPALNETSAYDNVGSLPWLPTKSPLDQGLPNGFNLMEESENSEHEDFAALDEEFGFDNTADVHDDAVDPDYVSVGEQSARDSQSSNDDFDYESTKGARRSLTGRGRGRGRGRRGGPFSDHISSSRGSRGGRGRGGRVRGKRRKREVDPGTEFKEYHGKATAAFIENRYEEALEFAQKAADANPKVFAMHNLVAKIWEAMGNKLRSVMALTVGAYSKRDKNLWWYIADQYEDIEDISDDVRNQRRTLCMYRILDIDKEDTEARSELVRINLDMNRFGSAMMQCRQILRRNPKDIEVLRQLAYICSVADAKQQGAQKSAAIFDESFKSFLQTDTPQNTVLDWSLLNIYLELLQRLNWHEQGLARLNEYSRWLLGRAEEKFWDEIDDDREWDLDDVRRREVNYFVKGKFSDVTYGGGLPLELRAKLGIFRLNHGRPEDRLESIRHFDLVYAISTSDNAEAIAEYSDLFRDTADVLKDFGHFDDALKFYKALENVPGQTNEQLFIALGDCHRSMGNNDDAFKYYRAILNVPGDLRIQARGRIVKILDERGDTEESLAQARLLARSKQGQDLLKDMQLNYEVPQELTQEKAPLVQQQRTVQRGPRTLKQPRTRQTRLPGLFDKDSFEAVHVQRTYRTLQALQDGVDRGDEGTIQMWIQNAQSIMQEFKDYENLIRIAILRKEREDKEARQAGIRNSETDPHLLLPATESASTVVDFTQFRGITYRNWLDIFLQYSFILASFGDRRSLSNLADCEAFEVFSRASEFVAEIRVCQLVCGILLNNEREICTVARWFLKQHPFATNSYRIYGIVNRLFSGHRTWYNSGPNQKFSLRHLRSVDWVLLSAEERKAHHFNIHSKSSFVLNNAGALAVEDHDPSLFAMYAHIMASGGKYVNALNYYFRAYAMRPDDPILNLCIGLSYLQLALKNKTENRQLNIQQGLSYLLRYGEIRTSSGLAIHEQETEFNLARAWHMLGLLHLAMPGYKKVMDLSARIVGESSQDTLTDDQKRLGTHENFAREAAYAVQQILALGEDYLGAREVTEEWLVIE